MGILNERKLRDEHTTVRLWSSGGKTMRVDSHLHLWQYTPDEFEWIPDSMASLRRDFLPQELNTLCADAAVDGVIAVQARQSLEETRWLLELAHAAPILGVV